ncbi:MAG: hypothetical protein ABSC94_13220 [Polyangiaceae bacterium]|jgi:hypothetical protein
MKSPVPAAALTSVFLAASCAHPLPGPYLVAPEEGDPTLQRAGTDGSVRIRPEVCRNVAENTPDERHLDETSIVAFLERQGYKTATERVRSDLVYVDVRGAEEEPVRLRVAILEDAGAAGQNLHRALIEHGAGAWGVHRSNLAVLAPPSTARHAVNFAGRTKLACWGVLTIAAGADAFVIPGGYMEF